MFDNYERVPVDTGPADADPATVTIGGDELGSEVPHSANLLPGDRPLGG
jgi:hypothetical protein